MKAPIPLTGSRHPGRTLAWILLAIFLTAAPTARAHGAWIEGGSAVAPGDSSQTSVAIAPDGAGGAFYAWTERHEARVVRLGADGATAPGWPDRGLVIQGAPNITSENPTLTPDGGGGVYATADPRTGYGSAVITRFSANGAVVAGWPLVIPGEMGGEPSLDFDRQAGHFAIQGTYASFGPMVSRTSDGNLLLGWTHASRISDHPHVTRVDPAGHPLPGWTLDGKVLGSVYGGGFLGGLRNDALAGCYAIRAAGSPLPYVLAVAHVDSDGGAVTDAPVVPGSLEQYGGSLVESGGGALVAWIDRRSGIDLVYVQRLLPDIGPAPGWPTGGLRISLNPSAAGTLRSKFGEPVLSVSMISDGEDGAYIAWTELQAGDEGDVRLQRVTAAGGIAAGWPEGGLALCRAAGDQRLPRLAAAGPRVLVAWQDARSGEYDVYAQQVNALGGLVWPTDGLPVCTAQGAQETPLVAVSNDAAVFAWLDRRSGVSNAYAASIPLDGATAVPSESPRPRAVALGEPHPNPTRGGWQIDLDLPSERPARLDVFDVRGRRVGGLRLEGLAAGSHLITLPETPSLAPGLYFLQLTQGGSTAVRRASVVR